MTQTEQVHAYMKENGSIDPLRAIQHLGILRLSARIWDLKNSGVPVETIRKTRKTEAGVKEWAEYRLIKEEPPGATNAERLKGGDDTSVVHLQNTISVQGGQ